MVKALVVVPAYRESGRIGALLDEVPACAAPGVDIRWLIVDDGSGPGEAAALGVAVERRGLSARVSVLALPGHEGKGAALAAGFERGLAEDAALIAFIDADASAKPSELARALARLVEKPELSGVIGSRILMLGRRVHRNAVRHYLGRLFATFVSLSFDAPVYDTQCGLKAFRAPAVRRHLQAPTDLRWVWDTQLLLAMLAAGEPIEELPIDWTESPGSRLQLGDPLLMAWSLLRFKWSRRGSA
jgi:glycosyltransferase involved in cell wall biosynthesis